MMLLTVVPLIWFACLLFVFFSERFPFICRAGLIDPGLVIEVFVDAIAVCIGEGPRTIQIMRVKFSVEMIASWCTGLFQRWSERQ